MKYPYKEKQAQLLAYNMMCSYVRNDPELGKSEKEDDRKKLAKTALEQARHIVYGTALDAPVADDMAKEQTVMDILSKMSRKSLESVKRMCEFATDKRAPPPTDEELNAARHILYRMNKADQKVSYYLIGRAREEHSMPAILTLF